MPLNDDQECFAKDCCSLKCPRSVEHLGHMVWLCESCENSMSVSLHKGCRKYCE